MPMLAALLMLAPSQAGPGAGPGVSRQPERTVRTVAASCADVRYRLELDATSASNAAIRIWVGETEAPEAETAKITSLVAVDAGITALWPVACGGSEEGLLVRVPVTRSSGIRANTLSFRVGPDRRVRQARIDPPPPPPPPPMRHPYRPASVTTQSIYVCKEGQNSVTVQYDDHGRPRLISMVRGLERARESVLDTLNKELWRFDAVSGFGYECGFGGDTLFVFGTMGSKRSAAWLHWSPLDGQVVSPARPIRAKDR